MRTLLVATAALLLVAPGAASTWRVAGTFEPDTSYDSEDWMWQDAPPKGSQRIYFNGITTSRAVVLGGSPNVGLLETRNEAPVWEEQVVLLGVWNDCNGDGYIGMAEHAFREYSAQLLLDQSRCPATTGPAGSWTVGAHNYNGWVSELLFIGRSGTQRIYQDPDVRVWGDYERPDRAPVLGQCPLQPHPRGTYQSTGGMMNFVGCRLDQKGIEWMRSWNQAMDEIGDPFGWSFDNEYDARSGSLGRIGTFGGEDTAYSPAYVWDCEAAPTQVGPVRVNAIDPRLGSAPPSQWTLPAFYNHTYEGIHPLDNCDTSNDRSGGFYVLEADYNAVNPRNKTEADWNFKFAAAGRGGPPLGTVLGPGGAGAPADGGIGWFGSSFSTVWGPDNVYGSKLGPNMIRANLEEAGLAPAYWVTFYAFLGEKTFERKLETPGSTGIYGSWHCGSHTTGIRNGWNCDADMWYRNADGSPYPPELPYVRPGQLYHLRDVDCYDGSTSVGLAAGLPAYGPDPCT
ncbi:MAG TPA: hypothetical protein VFH78_01025 [Candidatus Thermoplasmatota archaeon]|nr:hypothetical protein [Candidatus Thermoplasmatota archaeon]